MEEDMLYDEQLSCFCVTFTPEYQSVYGLPEEVLVSPAAEALSRGVVV